MVPLATNGSTAHSRKTAISGIFQGVFKLCLGLAALSCSTTPQPTANLPGPVLEIGGLVIENHTPFYISAVRLLVPATGSFVSCGNIASRAECSTTFPERAYSGNPVEVTWSQSGSIWSTGELRVQPPGEWEAESIALVRVVIAGPGSAGVELVRMPAAE